MNLTHDPSGSAINQRVTDGYINATALTTAHKQATGQRKDVANWLSNKRTQGTLECISSETGIPANHLYEVFGGAPSSGGGVWIHPRLLDLLIEFLCRPANSKPTFLYVIGDKERAVCKIGISANPYERLKKLQTGYPWTLDIWLELMIEAPEKVEKILHTRFADFRLNGEWFDAIVFKKLDLNELKEL